MKGMKFCVAAALALLGATNAHAGAYVFDFEGFTIRFSGSSDWDRAGKTDDTHFILHDTAWINGENITLGTGLENSYGGVKLSTSNLPQLSANNGNSSSATSSFSYTIAAKPGWQFLGVYAYGEQYGSYQQSAGGVVSTAITSSFAVSYGTDYVDYTGGAYPVYDEPVNNGDTVSGKWGYWLSQYREIAGIDQEITPLVDSEGREYGELYTNYVKGGSSLRSISGNFTFDLNAFTSGPGQTASLSGSFPTLHLSGAVVRTAPVSPVPEPDTYMMMAAAFGMFAILKRRKKHIAA